MNYGIKLIARVRGLLPLERLTLGCGLVAAAVIVWGTTDAVTTQTVLNDNASKLAQVLRDAKVTAADRKQFIAVRVRPATPSRLSTFEIADAEIGSLSPGVSAEGIFTFDPQGVPDRAAVLKVRKGTAHVNLQLSEMGKVHVAE
jgi:hypothetical protein